MNADSTVIVEQKLISGDYYFSVKVNGVDMFHPFKNEGAREFKNVKVYTSHPWSEPARAQLRSYKFENLQ